MRKILFLLAATLVAPAFLFSQTAPDPAWWTQEPTAIVVDPQAENNHAPVTLGQLKHVAEMAMKHLDIELAAIGGSSPFPYAAITVMVEAFDTYEGVPIDQNPNYSLINLGQLKAVAEPFYDRLLQIGYDTRQNLIDQGYDSSWPHDYPWDPDTPVEENHYPANIGQLKMVFSFDLAGFDTSQVDTNGDGIPDEWMIQYFGHLAFHGDDPHYRDGITLRQQYDLGLDPTSHDSDGDGITDRWKIRYFAGYDETLQEWYWVTPYRGPNDDPDNDDLTNLEEFELGTDPMNDDTDGDGMPDGWEVAHGFDPLDDGSRNWFLGPEGTAGFDSITNLQKYELGLDPWESYQHQPPILDKDPSPTYVGASIEVPVTNPNPVPESGGEWTGPGPLGFITYTINGDKPTSRDKRVNPEDPKITVEGNGRFTVRARVFSMGAKPSPVVEATYKIQPYSGSGITYYYGILTATNVPGYSSNEMAFQNGYLTLGIGWLDGEGLFVPRKSAASSNVYYGILSSGISGYSVHGSNFQGDFARMGSGWIEGPNSMITDFEKTHSDVYYGELTLDNDTVLIYSHGNPVTGWPPLNNYIRLSSGWVTGYDSMKASPSGAQELHYGKKTFSVGTKFVVARFKSDFDTDYSVTPSESFSVPIGVGWTTGHDSFKPDWNFIGENAAPVVGIIKDFGSQGTKRLYRVTPNTPMAPTSALYQWSLDGGWLEVKNGVVNHRKINFLSPSSGGSDVYQGDISIGGITETVLAYNTTSLTNVSYQGYGWILANEFIDGDVYSWFWQDDDGDGLFNGLEEHFYETDPHRWDSSGDFLYDGEKVDNGLDPLAFHEPHDDLDGDGFSNLLERIRGTDPLDSESTPDLEGLTDFDEENYSQALFGLTGGSGCTTEFKMTIKPEPPHLPEFEPLVFWSLSYREPVSNQPFVLRRGVTWEIKIEAIEPDTAEPQYDYAATFNVLGGAPHILDDPEELLGSHGHDPDFPGDGKTAWLHLMKLDFQPRPGKVFYGFDGETEEHPWTSMTAGTQSVESDIVRVFIEPEAVRDRIRFEATEGVGHLANVDANDRLLVSPSGGEFELTGEYTDFPLHSVPLGNLHSQGDDIWHSVIAARELKDDGTLGSDELAKLGVVILEKRTPTVHLVRVIDSESPESYLDDPEDPTSEFQMPDMDQLTGQLNDLFFQAGIEFQKGGEFTADIKYDTSPKNGLLDTGEEPILKELLFNWIQENHPDPASITTDFFAFVFRESNIDEGTPLNSGGTYKARGGNVTDRVEDFTHIYGPYVASVGFSDVHEIARAISHEIGHALNLPINSWERPMLPAHFRQVQLGDRVFYYEPGPPLDADHPNTTGGHDNFNFPNPDFPDNGSKRVWSFVRSGVYKGDIIQLDEWSRWLRKVYWEEGNLRLRERLLDGGGEP